MRPGYPQYLTISSPAMFAAGSQESELAGRVALPMHQEPLPKALSFAILMPQQVVHFKQLTGKQLLQLDADVIIAQVGHVGGRLPSLCVPPVCCLLQPLHLVEEFFVRLAGSAPVGDRDGSKRLVGYRGRAAATTVQSRDQLDHTIVTNPARVVSSSDP
jgi:hypothetical protein